MSDHLSSRKPLALLIPGLDGTGLLFYRQVEALSARYRIRAWNFRRRSRFDFPGLVEELREGTEGEEPKSILVVGESFGGPIALHYVLALPERVRSLALINAFPYYRGRRRIRLICALAPLLRWSAARGVKNWLVDRTLAFEGILPGDRARYRRIVQQIDQHAYRQRLELVKQVDLRAELEKITVPTILFASGRDKIVAAVREARGMASIIPHAKLHEFPRAGHALLLTPGFSLADYL